MKDGQDTYEYILNKLKRPVFNRLQRLILKLNNVPLLRNLWPVKKLIYSIYNLPKSCHINYNFYCSAPLLQIGRNVGLEDTYIVAYAPVIIGDNSSFSFRNMIITSTHDITDFSTVIGKTVRIGNNVWITSNVTILAGVTIGDNTIIGAGSVVSRDIPGGVFAAGNPCKIIKRIEFWK